MTRRRSRGPSRAWNRRAYRYPALLPVAYPRRAGEHEAEQRAASLISDGQFLTRTTWEGIVYLFTSPAHAHTMHVWFEANGRPDDPWDDKLQSWASTARREKEIADLVNGAAATGVLDRLSAASCLGGREAAIVLLQEIEPGFGRMEASTAVELICQAMA